MNIKKIFHILFISSLIMIIFSSCSKEPKNKNQIDAEIQIGYDGVVKISSGNPFLAKITNKGKAFVGEIQIEVEDSQATKILIAQPFEIEENASKEISFELPVYVIQKAFNINITSGKRKIYQETVQIKKVLPPDRKIMAVFTDSPDRYRFLENTKLKNLPEIFDAYDKYGGYTKPTQEEKEEQNKLEVVYLSDIQKIDTKEKLSYFNYIYIGHNQNLTISTKQEEQIREWIERGNSFVFETGADYKKINKQLPSSLNPNPVTQVNQVEISTLWKNLPLSSPIEIARTDQIDQTKTSYIENGTENIGTQTKVGDGYIISLFVNLGLEPLASWNLKAPFIESVLDEFTISQYQNYDVQSGQFQYLSNQLPTSKKPPYTFMLILFGAYILLVAPIAYFILKKYDKRDFAWIGIPFLAILCMVIIYIYGLQTRYTKGIMNSISVLTAQEESNVMNIQSDITIFNNQKDLLKLEWDPSENVNLNLTNQNDYYRYRDQEVNQKKNITSKITYGNSYQFEKYNAGLWGTTYIQANKQIPFQSADMMLVKLDENKIQIHLTNTTPYQLEKAFIKWGQGLIYVGDLEPGEKITIEKQLDQNLNQSFEQFLEKEMKLKRFDYSKRPTDKEREEIKLYELLMQRNAQYDYKQQSLPSIKSNIEEIKLSALNYQKVGYDIQVNGERPEDYETNFIEISSKFNLEKNSQVKIPMGILAPTATYALDETFSNEGSMDYQFQDQFYRAYDNGIAQFDFQIPKSILVEKIEIAIGEVYDEEDYYNKQNGQQANPIKTLEYSLYNPIKNEWEIVDQNFKLTDMKYMNPTGHLQVRVDLRENKNNKSYCQMIKAPSVSIEGRVE